MNFDWENETQVLNKIDEEIHELKDALKVNNKKMIEEELGDLFFTIINLSRRLNFCLLYTSPSPRDVEESRMPSSA